MRIAQMIEICNEKDIYWFHELVDYCCEHRKDLLQTLTTERGTCVMATYLASKARVAGLINDTQYEEELERCCEVAEHKQS